MRASGDDQDGPDADRGGAAERPRTDSEPDSIRDIGEIRRAAAWLGDLGLAEFAGLAAALATIEGDLAVSDPRHPDGHRLRQDLKTRLDDLGEALRRLLDLIDRLRRRPI